MGAAKRVTLNTGILYGRMGITIFISLYSTRLILNGLGVEDFGIFNLVGGTIAMLGFLNASMASSTQRFMSYAQGAGDTHQIKKIFNMSLVLHCAIAAIIFLILELAGYFLFHGILNIADNRINAAMMVYQFMIVSTLFTIISVPYDAVINARENMLLYAIIGIIEALLKLLIAIYISNTQLDRLLVYGAMMASLSLFILAIRVLYCQVKYKECKISLGAHYDKNLVKEMTGFTGWSLLGSSSSMIVNYGQGILMNFFFGTRVNAAQGVSNQVSGQLSAFAVTMLKALNPIIAKSEGAGNRELMLKASMVGSKVGFFLLMLFYIPVLIEMPYIFAFWLKEVPDYAILFCRLLLLRDLIGQLFVTLSSSISAVGNIRRFQIYSSLLTCSPLLACVVLYHFHSPPETLYYVFLVYTVLMSALIVYFAKINCELPVPYFLENVVVRCSCTFLLSILISSSPLVFMDSGFFRLLIVSTLSLFTFGIGVWSIGLSKQERGIFQKNLSQLPKTLQNRVKLFPLLNRKSYAVRK